MPLQGWIHHWEEGAGAKVLKVAAAILGFVVLAGLYDALDGQGFSSEEAMETAQLARNLARGKGYTTQSIRPLSIYLLRRQAPPGQAAGILGHPVPDLSTPPAYPVLLAGLMAVLPFDYSVNRNENDYWYFAPDRWIGVFNQVLLLAAVVLLFRIARRLFDARVAWLSATLLACSHLYWKFTVSGLSTVWLMAVLLAVALALIHLHEREQSGGGVFGSLVLAGLSGGLIGVGGLTRYAMIWMIFPVLVFIQLASPRARNRLCAVAGAAFLIVIGPWVARNLLVSGNCFGTASYAVLDQTPSFPGDTLERSFDPESGFRRMLPLDVVNKLLLNARGMWRDELPRLGGNWVSAFFLVGLLVPFRHPGAWRMRVFLLCSMGVLIVAQAGGRTHLSVDEPEINSENLLALLAPMLCVYGVALFYTLIDQLQLLTIDVRGAVVAGFVVITCAPLWMSWLAGRSPDPNTPYSPLHIQTVARMMQSDELMVSDIPGGVAWYGDRQCGWLPLDDDQQFYHFNSLKPIKAVFLTQRTTNSRFLSQMMNVPKSWGHFVAECWAHEEVPAGFPLNKAPFGLLPDQMLVSDHARWGMLP